MGKLDSTCLYSPPHLDPAAQENRGGFQHRVDVRVSRGFQHALQQHHFVANEIFHGGCLCGRVRLQRHEEAFFGEAEVRLGVGDGLPAQVDAAGLQRGVAVQVEFESKGLKPSLSLHRLKGWKPGAFKLWVN
jgi:hypothetical protein